MYLFIRFVVFLFSKIPYPSCYCLTLTFPPCHDVVFPRPDHSLSADIDPFVSSLWLPLLRLVTASSMFVLSPTDACITGSWLLTTSPKPPVTYLRLHPFGNLLSCTFIRHNFVHRVLNPSLYPTIGIPTATIIMTRHPFSYTS